MSSPGIPLIARVPAGARGLQATADFLDRAAKVECPRLVVYGMFNRAHHWRPPRAGPGNARSKARVAFPRGIGMWQSGGRSPRQRRGRIPAALAQPRSGVGPRGRPGLLRRVVRGNSGSRRRNPHRERRRLGSSAGAARLRRTHIAPRLGTDLTDAFDPGTLLGSRPTLAPDADGVDDCALPALPRDRRTVTACDEARFFAGLGRGRSFDGARQSSETRRAHGAANLFDRRHQTIRFSSKSLELLTFLDEEKRLDL